MNDKENKMLTGRKFEGILLTEVKWEQVCVAYNYLYGKLEVRLKICYG